MQCVVGVLVNTPIQRAMFVVLKHDGKRDHRVRRHAARMRGLYDGAESDAEGGVVDPAAIVLACGSKLADCLQEGASILSEAAPAHVVCFRSWFSGEAVILQVWRSLLPGMAQLWFRLHTTYVNQFPCRLLRLVLDDGAVPAAEKRQIVTELLAAPDCCLDTGLSLPLRDISMRCYDDHASRVAFFGSPYVMRLLDFLACRRSCSCSRRRRAVMGRRAVGLPCRVCHGHGVSLRQLSAASRQ